MTTSWADPLSLHPWFRMPSLKRKDVAEDDDDLFHPPSPPSPRIKRRRCDVLEHGIAQLTLDVHVPAQHPAHVVPAVPPVIPPNVHPAYAWSSPLAPVWDAPTPTPVHADTHPTSVVLPGSVEEPTSPVQAASVHDITMKSPSWYEIEKDRIVITDLEDSDAEGSEDESPPESTAEWTVSPALLRRIATTSAMPSPLTAAHMEPESSQALVLYKPLPLPEDASRVKEIPESVGGRTTEADDAMDQSESEPVAYDDEPMDIEPF